MSINDFIIMDKLGEGAYSQVFKALRIKDKQIYALKKVKTENLSQKEIENALNEIRILASIKNNNIIAYKEAFLDKNTANLCIIMEYCDNGDLLQKIIDNQKRGTSFKEEDIWHIFIQIVNGLKALHKLKIYHRDMKSANIFLNKDQTVKLGDMNVSKIAKNNLLYTQTGTPYYASPEVWKDQPYDEKSDIWSLGCVLYEMTALHPPFRSQDMEGLFNKVTRGIYGKIKNDYSKDLAFVIKQLLQVKPKNRPKTEQILGFRQVFKRINEKHTIVVENTNDILYSTILLPENIFQLTLPKPNYSKYELVCVPKGMIAQENLQLPKIQNIRFMSFDRNKEALGSIANKDSQSVERIEKDKKILGNKGRKINNVVNIIDINSLLEVTSLPRINKSEKLPLICQNQYDLSYGKNKSQSRERDKRIQSRVIKERYQQMKKLQSTPEKLDIKIIKCNIK